MKKRLISFLLSAAMVFTSMPMQAFAADDDEEIDWSGSSVQQGAAGHLDVTIFERNNPNADLIEVMPGDWVRFMIQMGDVSTNGVSAIQADFLLPGEERDAEGSTEYFELRAASTLNSAVQEDYTYYDEALGENVSIKVNVFGHRDYEYVKSTGTLKILMEKPYYGRTELSPTGTTEATDLLLVATVAKAPMPTTEIELSDIIFGISTKTDEGLVQKTYTPKVNSISVHIHDAQPVNASSGSCTEDSIQAHWKCTLCGKLFADENGKAGAEVDKSDVVIPAAHKLGDLIPETPAGCDSTGIKAHYVCQVCNRNIAEDGTTVLDDLTIPVTHVYGTLKPEVPANCGVAGTKAHYTCEICGRNFDESKTEISSIVIPALTHTIVEGTEVKNPDCTNTGIEKYWICTTEGGCGKFFSKEDGSGEIDAPIVIEALGHNMTHMDGKLPTCQEEGVREHYFCSRCSKYFFDKDGNDEITETDTVVSPLDHDWADKWSYDETQHYYLCVRENCGEKHEVNDHTFERSVDQNHLKSEATCDSLAMYYVSCSVCDMNGTAVFSAGGYAHPALQKTDEVPATCGANGKKAYWYCETCQKYFLNAEGTPPAYVNTDHADFVIPATGAHQFTAQKAEEQYLAQAATCTSEATYYVSCEVCGAKGSKTFKHGDKLQHQFTAQKVAEQYLDQAATCTSKATYYESCSVCGETGTNTFEYGELLPHDYTAEKVDIMYRVADRTCEKAAEYYKSCVACGEKGNETFFDAEQPAYGHANSSEWVVDDENDKHWQKCERYADCGYKFNEGGHSFTIAKEDGANTKASDATCTKAEMHYYSCECGTVNKDKNKVFEGTTKALGHDLVDGWVKDDPAGHWRKCTRCDEKVDFQSHDAGMKSDETNHWGECGTCGYTVNVTAHTWGAKVHEDYLYEAATCETKATYFKSCEVCGAKGSETFFDGPLAHEMTKHEAVAESCATPGNKEYWSCSECGKYFLTKDGEGIACTDPKQEPIMIPANGNHDYVKETANEDTLCDAATCLEKATYYYSCNICDKVEKNKAHVFSSGELAAHKYEKEIANETTLCEAATCTSQATYYKSCSVCDAVSKNKEDIFSYGDLAAHIYGQRVVADRYKVSAATCTAEGVYKLSCTCGAASPNEADVFNTPKLAHVMSHTPELAPTCTTLGREEYWTCSSCGQNYATADGDNEAGESTKVDDLSALDIKKLPHATTHVKAVEPKCEENGNIEYWLCDGDEDQAGCGKYFKDQACTEEISKDDTVVKMTNHPKLTKIDAKDPTCEEAGNIDYWTCGDCDAIFNSEDKAKKITLEDTVVDALGHKANTSKWLNDATKHWHACQNGCDKHLDEADHNTSNGGSDANDHWYECSVCAYVQERVPHAYANLVKADLLVKEATCTEHAVYKKSCICGKVHPSETFIDTEGKLKAHVYDKEVIDDKYKVSDANCIEEAVYKKSCVCGDMGTETFQDIAGGLNANKHIGAFIKEAKDPNCLNSGNIRHWECSDCHALMLDASADGEEKYGANTTLEAVTLKALGHLNDNHVFVHDEETHWEVCERENCGAMIPGSEAAHDYETTTSKNMLIHECKVCDYSYNEFKAADDSQTSVQQGASSTLTIKIAVNSMSTKLSSMVVGDNTLEEGTDYTAEVQEEKDAAGNGTGKMIMVVTMKSSAVNAMNTGKNQVQMKLTETKINADGTTTKITVDATTEVEVTRAPSSSGSSDTDWTVDEDDDDRISNSDVREEFKDAKDDTVTFRLTGDNTEISRTVFSLLKKNKDMTVVIKGDGYSWTFNGSDIEGTFGKAYFDAEVRDTSPKAGKIKKLTGNAKIQHIRTMYSGDLPGIATLTVTVDKALRNDLLNCYRYDPETNTLELVAAGLKVKNGKVSVVLDHCSDYILTNATFHSSVSADKVNPETGAADLSAVSVAALAMLGLAVIVSKKR